MVIVKPVERWKRKGIKHALTSYLDGEKNLNWTIGEIKYFYVGKETLKKIFDELKDYGDKSRFQAVMQECERQGLS